MAISPSHRCSSPPVPSATRVQPLAAHRARFTFEPLAQGFGTTLGVALQRVMGSSLPGCAPTKVRLARRTDRERLVLDVATDGSITPCEALDQGARLLMAALDRYAVAPDARCITRIDDWMDCMGPIDALHLSVRASNCLKAEHIHLVADLVQRSERDLLRTPNLGRKCLQEIKAALAALGLTLAAPPPTWPHAGPPRRSP